MNLLKISLFIIWVLFIISIICTILEPNIRNFICNILCLSCCGLCHLNYKEIKQANKEFEELNKLISNYEIS